MGRAHRVAPGAYALFHDQLGPLEGLHADECGAQCRSDQQQDKGHLPVLFITKLDGHRHRPAAADQDEGHDRDQEQRDLLAEQRQRENLAGDCFLFSARLHTWLTISTFRVISGGP